MEKENLKLIPFGFRVPYFKYSNYMLIGGFDVGFFLLIQDKNKNKKMCFRNINKRVFIENIAEKVKRERWEKLGHLLRMEKNKTRLYCLDLDTSREKKE